MIKLRKLSLYTFARNRIRRQIQFDPKLRDYTTNQQVKLQTQKMRQEFQKIPTDKFSTILDDPHPKLGKRFYVQKQSLNKKIGQLYRSDISRQKLQSHDQTDFQFLDASKSELIDQTKQLQFQEKFKQQLFRTKQTRRLIEKKQKNINNYLPDKQKDYKFLQYEQAKKSLKNKKISNMMNMNRNNQQLELLIQSGLFNNPQNLQSIINQIAKQKQPLLQSQHSITNPNISSNCTQVTNPQIQTALSLSLSDIGPQALKQRGKIEKFIKNLQQEHQKDKQSCLEDLNLLKQIRQYQQQVFLSRYGSINFRFKGKVDFNFFKQNQLVSYIKHSKIAPKDLLLIYKQNQNRVNKFNVPIITPPVMSTLYSKTSLYRYPESQTNNRINMLDDPNFQALQRNTFKQITQINDTDFCSIVWAYARNHEDQQGLLKQKLYDKINQVIIQQLKFRIYRLQEKDLGLVLRGMKKLNLSQQSEKWGYIVQCLDKRFNQIKDAYAVQSIFQFLMCLPTNKLIVNIVSRNINKYKEYEWTQVSNVQSFVNTSGLLLLYSNQKVLDCKKNLQQIVVFQQKNLYKIIPQISINNMPHFVTVLKETETSLSLPKLVNLCKKSIVDNIKTQKQLIKQPSLYNITASFALVDFQKYLNKSKSKFLRAEQIVKNYQADARKYSLKSIIPFQPIPYNSAQFFIYHDIAQLAYTQMHNIPNIFLSKLLQQLSLTRYKNQPLQDQIATKILRDLQQYPKTRFQLPLHNSQTTHTHILMALINTYTFQKRYNQILQDTIQKLFTNKNYFTIFSKQSTNMLLRFLTGLVSLDIQQNQQRKQLILKIFNNIIVPQIKSNIFIQQQLASIAYITTMLNKFQTIDLLLQNIKLEDLKQPASKFVLKFCSLIAQLSKQNNKQLKQEKLQQFQIAQKQFYSAYQEQIVNNQLSIGSPLPYKTVFKKIQQKILQQAPQSSKQNYLIVKPWRIQIPNQNTVYFIATYDHLMVSPSAVIKQQKSLSQMQRGQQPIQKDMNLELYGIWKLYKKLYKIKDFKFKIVVSFLQGR